MNRYIMRGGYGFELEYWNNRRICDLHDRRSLSVEGLGYMVMESEEASFYEKRCDRRFFDISGPRIDF